MFWRCLHESSSGRFLGGSCIKILKDPLQQQQVLLTILWDSVGGAGPASRSCSRSFSVPYAKIRLKSSLQGPCIKILNVLLGCSQEVLVWRCALYIDLYIRSCCSSCNPAYNLICYCSIATVACIWYIDFSYQPHCLGPLAGVIPESAWAGIRFWPYSGLIPWLFWWILNKALIRP